MGKIEKAIDTGLDSISTSLNIGSIVLGVLVLIMGLIFCIQKKSDKLHKFCWLPLVFGALLIISGVIKLL